MRTVGAEDTCRVGCTIPFNGFYVLSLLVMVGITLRFDRIYVGVQLYTFGGFGLKAYTMMDTYIHSDK